MACGRALTTSHRKEHILSPTARLLSMLVLHHNENTELSGVHSTSTILCYQTISPDETPFRYVVASSPYGAASIRSYFVERNGDLGWYCKIEEHAGPTFSNVDFPHPLMPTRPNFWPLHTVNCRSSNWNRVPSKVLVSPSAMRSCGVPVTIYKHRRGELFYVDGGWVAR